MEFKFENHAKAGSGIVSINDLSIICGPNNSGKTYINYAIFSILKNFLNLFDFGVVEESVKDALTELQEKGSVQIDLSSVSDKLLEVKSKFVWIIGPKIGSYFQLPEANFQDTNIYVRLKKLKFGKKTGIIEIMNDMFCEYHFEKDNFKLIFTLKKNGKHTQPGYWSEPFSSQHVIRQINSLIFMEYLSDIVPNPFSTASERTGISLFYKSFDYGNKEAIKFVNNRINQNRLRDMSKVGSKLAEAVEDNIDYTRAFENYRSTDSFIVSKKMNDLINLFNEIIDNGTYESRNNSLFYRPKDSANEPTIPLESSSSSIKSFFLFDMFIRNVAQEGDLLVIDEPELSLHIEKQLEVTHLIARLVNAGVKVLITTHSDFLIREVNNLITLSSSKKEDRKKLMEEYGLLESDILSESQVNAYTTDLNKKIEPLAMHTSGIDPDSWNKIIARENYKTRRIFDLIGD